MTNKEILERLEEIEYLLRYYNLSGKTEIELLIKAVGQMGEARVHVEELVKEIKSIVANDRQMTTEQLELEINHILDSGANSIRLVNLFNRYANQQTVGTPEK